ncbi:aminotransferase [Actinoplanes sp. SE50]|uniref:pyridoxal phosphate-dependent aminotransferase n=1 Tax=unclassified Actinoplanes TaxID=2626549 RepID=UPI00023EC176|nr:MULTISPECIES: pyridoxal phosphate-dependent aminotransferase [unclassified Actinoplanes]AEV86970.1 aspartate aminotransferase [Actinoplanes sp. SE50/110]ATO85366.1 aminotransferase [Actinoplanes sp. SE50]SLM02778.1 aminotransferase [Actinoplanes sp. SE50/110]
MTRHIAPNMALDQRIAERQAAGERIVHLGFGEARLPVFAPLAERLAAGAARNRYGAVVGDLPVRTALAGYFTRRGLPTEPGQVMTAPGSKALLIGVQLALPGDIVLPAPCWNTYLPQAVLAGKTPITVPIPAGCGGVPDPELLPGALRAARAAGHHPRIMLLTLPDNPTGTVADPETIRRLCAIADREDLWILSDEIYRDILHGPEVAFRSPAELLPERTVVTTGLSKNLALGGWRIGGARFPASPQGERLRADVAAVASETWSALAQPMQEVAAYAFSEPPEIRRHLAAGARLHAVVARAVYEIMVGAGATCRPPAGGFYVYPDFEPLRGHLAGHGITDAASLEHELLETAGVAVLGGHHQGDDPAALRFRAATSLLYGDTDAERAAALAAADPVALPHIRDILARLEEGLAKLCR